MGEGAILSLVASLITDANFCTFLASFRWGSGLYVIVIVPKTVYNLLTNVSLISLTILSVIKLVFKIWVSTFPF